MRVVAGSATGLSWGLERGSGGGGAHASLSTAANADLNASAPKNFFFCNDSYSSILSAVPWVWSSPRFPLNYLALFIIQRLSWRQALGSQKENCFYTYKWKKAGRLKCKPLSFVGTWNLIYNFFAWLAYPLLHFCLIYLLLPFQFYFFSLGRNRMIRNTNPQKTNNVLKERENHTSGFQEQL